MLGLVAAVRREQEVVLAELTTRSAQARILIPSQPAHVRPMLVRGALVAGKVLGSHVSVPVRVGEETRHWDASTLHSLIQAGRVALQRAEAGEADRA